MVIAADGTKWSCISCLKGHRVSGCNHTDRELKLVPKKGRPVTQCQHCRQERKKRSAHVKCDCAEPDKPHHSKEKCIHLREAEDRNKPAHYDDPVHHDKDVAHMTAVAEEQGCCCHHGGKCSCALFHKDSDEGNSRFCNVGRKPRLGSTRSDSSITTIYSSPHHTLTHRNHAAHESGMPYKIPFSRAKTEQQIPRSMRRSVDNLGLNSPSASASAFTTSLDTYHAQNQNERSSSSRAPQMFDHAGVLMSSEQDHGGFADVDKHYADTPDLPTGSTLAFDSNIDPAIQPAFGDWSAFESGDLLDASNSGRSQMVTSNADIVGLAQPALTAASSGTQSEIDELPAIEDIFAHGMPSIQEMADFSQTADSPNGGMSQPNRRSLPPNFFGNMDFSIPMTHENWQAQVSDSDNSMYSKNMQDLGFANPWDATNSPAKAVYGGSSSPAPNMDVLKQLFPDMDMDTHYSPGNTRQQSVTSHAGQLGDLTDHTVRSSSLPQGRAMSGQD